MFKNIYKNLIVEKPKLTLFILTLLLLSFTFFAKDFQLDASSDTLLLENDPDLKYLREVNTKYGSKDYFVLTYTPNKNLLEPDTINNLTSLKNDLKDLEWVNNIITILDVPLLKNNDDPLSERIKNFKTLSSEDVDKERGFEEIINSPIFKEFVISKDGKTSGIIVYIKTDKKMIDLIGAKNKYLDNLNAGLLSNEDKKEYKKFIK
jgi:predicted RND superfamily exporter protein